MLYRTHCTRSSSAQPDQGASGSSTISARLWVLAGTPDHVSGGDWSLPSQVCWPGMSAFWANALEVSCLVVFLSAA